MKIHLLFFLPALLLLFTAGCDLPAGKGVAADQSRQMRDALAAERLGEFDKALAYYDEVIALYPRYAMAYLQVAIILHEKKKDYIGAIYNYDKYTRLAGRGRDSGNISIVSNRMVKARQLLTAQCAKTISAGSADRNVALMSNIATLNERIAKLESEKQILVSSNEVLRGEIQTRDNRITRLSLYMERMKSSSDGDGPKSAGSMAGIVQLQTFSNEDGTKTSVQTYEVKSGDTLSRIAEIAYGDASKWPRIKKANPDKIKDDRVHPGDVLIIPE
jgi:tetratricopeptide (TPR) repeat protein